MLKCVIFDMDGVLIDSHPIHKKAWQRFLQSVNRGTTPEDLDFVLDGRKRDDILRHFLGELSTEQLAEYGHRKEAFFRAEAENVQLIDGLDGFLHELRGAGIPMAVASCGSARRVHFILDTLQLNQVFSAIVTGDDVVHGKPSPDIFLKAADQLGVTADCSLVVEDAISGVLAAKSAGMKCLAVASNGRGSALKSAGADDVVPNFVEVTLKRVTQLFRQPSQRYASVGVRSS